MSGILPWFFVVGAQKAGTSTLHDWLSKSCEVALPWSKETHFFMDERLFAKGEQWYLKQFKTQSTQTRVIGEVDPEYMYFPECAERMRGFVNAPKLIFVLRDPLSRAYSNYLMSVRWGYEALSFTDALRAEDERLRSGGRFSQIHHGYLARGLYAGQIERMRAVFPESRVMFLLFDELFSSQEAATESLRKICEFVGIQHEGLSVDVSVRENQSAEPRFMFIRDFIYKQGTVKKLFGKVIPSREVKIRIMMCLDRLNMKPVPRARLGKAMEQQEIPSFVYESFIRDLRKVEKLTNIDLSKWVIEYEKRLAK